MSSDQRERDEEPDAETVGKVLDLLLALAKSKPTPEKGPDDE